VRTGPYQPWRNWRLPDRPRLGWILPDLGLAALEERHRWPLWLPVALGTGAAIYFALPIEPPLLVGWTAAALFLAAALAAFQSNRIWSRALLAGLAALSLGFAAAKLREERVSAPVLTQPLVAHLTGRVAALDWGRSGLRVVVGDVRSGRLPNPPALVRVLVRRGAEDIRVGQGIGLTAQLMPPPGPTEPGDGDFGRAAYFAQIGAVGFAYGAPETLPLARPPGPTERLSGFIEAMRARMTARIRAALPPSRGAIASAIITGERGGIDAEDESALRDAGLAHVLAIAGLHMALVGAGFFWLIRALLAAVPALALTYPIKKWAAGAALLVSGLYLVISGAASSATRAFVMLAMMLLAILLDRPALSMRSLGLAAAILLLLRPEAVTEPGFQMSFAAVASLIAVAEWAQGRARLVPHGWLYRHLRGIAVTSLVASLATLPFVMFYFGRASHYAVLGNLLAMPVMGLWVMPAAALSVAAMPFGLEHAPLQLLGSGIGVMLDLGRFVSGLPGAVSLTPSFPRAALVLMVLGGLWLLLWRRSWRWWGLAPILAGVVLALTAPRYDLLVASDARTVALRGPDGLLHFPRPPKDRYTANRWLQRDGDPRGWQDAVGGNFIRCDGVGCVARRHGLLIASGLRAEALADDCAKANVVISAAPVMACNAPKLVLDQKRIAAGGGYAVTLSPLRALSVNRWRGARPWVPASQ
jgi:competence protein ComEC